MVRKYHEASSPLMVRFFSEALRRKMKRFGAGTNRILQELLSVLGTKIYFLCVPIAAILGEYSASSKTARCIG